MSAMASTLTINTDGLDAEDVKRLREGIAKLLAELEATEVHADAVLGWGEAAAAEFYGRLFAANRPVQAKVIHAAAMAGGICDRKTVYELGGYDESRSLKGFTKPVTRIMKQMQAEGELPIDAADPMKPIYDWENPSFQKAQGFEMPAKLATLFAELAGPLT